jgi:ribonucleoside-diphosphate reductase alpha chain
MNVSGQLTQEEFNRRATMVARIATYQAAYTDFTYLTPEWKEMTERDALIGVSMTGIAAGNVASLNQKEAVECIIAENRRVAAQLGINSAKRVTVGKPAATTSLVMGSIGNGAHACFAEWYLRRIRVLKSEPVYTYLESKHPNLVEDDETNEDAIIHIPQRTPPGDVKLRTTETALEFLNRLKDLHRNWIEPGHLWGDNMNNMSATVTIRDYEWSDVNEWLWKNRAHYNGITLLPYDDHIYKQAPFESISEKRFNELYASLKEIRLDKVLESYSEHEKKIVPEPACSGGVCTLTRF